MYNHVYMMFQSSILSLLMAIKIYSKSLKVALTVQYWLFINWQLKKESVYVTSNLRVSWNLWEDEQGTLVFEGAYTRGKSKSQKCWTFERFKNFMVKVNLWKDWPLDIPPKYNSRRTFPRRQVPEVVSQVLSQVFNRCF